MLIVSCFTLPLTATYLLCLTIAMATSEDHAFAAISKQPFPCLLQSVKHAPLSKSRRTMAAWPCPHATCNPESPSVSWRSTEASKSNRTWVHCRLFFSTDHILKAVRELLSLLSTSAPNLRSVSQAFLWKTRKKEKECLLMVKIDPFNTNTHANTHLRVDFISLEENLFSQRSRFCNWRKIVKDQFTENWNYQLALSGLFHKQRNKIS